MAQTTCNKQCNITLTLCDLFSFVLVLLVSNVSSQWVIEDEGCRTPDRGRGDCVPIKECQPILDFITQSPTPITPKVQERLKQYMCGYQGRSVKVCCPQNPLVSEPPDVSRHRNVKLLPTKCGYVDTENKIINGEKTGLFEFPWMVLISYRTKNSLDFQCGGTILNERYILTAAHCISDYILSQRNSSIAGVRVGDHNVNTDRDCETIRNVTTCAPPFQDFRVEKIIPHQMYNPNVNLNYDIGLLRLAGRIDLNKENMRPVCLPLGSSRTYDFVNNNNKGVVTGWGATTTNRNSPELLKVVLEVVPLERCQEVYKSKNVKSPITFKHFCAGGKNYRDSCTGDSGGPLHAIVPDDDEDSVVKYVQQGIVSFGPKNCGAEGFPGVYTRIAYYMDWILNNIQP
ncbi:phenoloxidase-activating factor 1 [Aethina tumida]|uniref:phenoloxidase-activating factor 1 n=1 Tax=Aethina tumida TaxID=116153 RepID=UPI00096B6497|nr:phenoloxidase-activating factor 1 [Aethina tumida]